MGIWTDILTMLFPLIPILITSYAQYVNDLLPSVQCLPSLKFIVFNCFFCFFDSSHHAAHKILVTAPKYCDITFSLLMVLLYGPLSLSYISLSLTSVLSL